MKIVTAAAWTVIALTVSAASAGAQAPSLEDLARVHGGNLSPGSAAGGGSGGSAAGSGKLVPVPVPAPGSGSSSAAATPRAPTAATAGSYFGAIAFTADGSYSTGWKYRTKAEAEAYVATKCSAFGRGACKVIGFVGSLCAGLASYNGSHSGKRYRLAFTGGGTTASEAQSAALNRCNGDSRTRNRCQLRTVVCGDGR